MQLLRVVIASAVVPLLALSAWGEEIHQQQPFPGLFSLLSRFALSLILIIVLIWGTVYLLRRASNPGKTGKSVMIKVMARTFIAPKKGIYLVRVAGKVIALGITDSQITKLAEFSPEEVFEFPTNPNQSGLEGHTFLRQLKSKLNLWGEKWRNNTGKDRQLR